MTSIPRGKSEFLNSYYSKSLLLFMPSSCANAHNAKRCFSCSVQCARGVALSQHAVLGGLFDPTWVRWQQRVWPERDWVLV